MHESTGFSIWEYSAIIFAVVVISKLISLTRPEPAPVPDDMPEYRKMMEEEKRRYMK